MMIRLTNLLTITSSLLTTLLAVQQQSLVSMVISLPLAFFAARTWISREARMAVASVLLDQVRHEMECAPEEDREEFMRAYDELQERRRKWWKV